MRGNDCHHRDCRNPSETGFWCQDCIEAEWPYAPVGDGRHWILWKGVNKIADDLFVGTLGCPYGLGNVSLWLGETCPWLNRPRNWLLSPLGAIKEGHGDHILAAVVPVAGCQLRPDLVVDSTSPALSLTAFPRTELPSIPGAGQLLASVNRYAEQIDAFEQGMREQLELPSDYAFALEDAIKTASYFKRMPMPTTTTPTEFAWRLSAFGPYGYPASLQKLLPLTEHDRLLLKLRYGLEGASPPKQQHLGRIFLTRERLLKRLRSFLRGFFFGGKDR